MGLGTSCMNVPSLGLYTIELEAEVIWNRWKSQFEMLRLNENEIGQLYRVFINVDLKQRKIVQTSHLANYLKVENKLFAKRMLSSFRRGVKFEGFVFEIWDLCTIEEKDLADFVFNLYDEDRSGDISMEEAQIMLNELYGEEFFKDGSNRGKDILEQLYSADDILSFEKVSFREFTKKQPSVLFLAFSVQKSIMRGLIGKEFWQKQIKKRMKLYKSEIEAISRLREDILLGKFVAPVELRLETSDEDLMTMQLNKDKPINVNGISKAPSISIIATNITPRAPNIDTHVSSKAKLLEKQLSERFNPLSPRPTSARPSRPGSANTRSASARNLQFKEDVIQISADPTGLLPVPNEISPEFVEMKHKKSRKRMEYKGSVTSELMPPSTEIARENGNDGFKKQNLTIMTTNGDKLKGANDKNININNAQDNLQIKLESPLKREKKVLDDLTPSPANKKSRKRVAYKGLIVSLQSKTDDEKDVNSPDMILKRNKSETLNVTPPTMIIKRNQSEMLTEISKDIDREGLIAFEEVISNDVAIDRPHSKECIKSALKTSVSASTIEETKVKSRFSLMIGDQLRNSSILRDISFSKVGGFSSKMASRPASSKMSVKFE